MLTSLYTQPSLTPFASPTPCSNTVKTPPNSLQNIKSMSHLQQLHAQIIKTGTSLDNFSIAPLISFCALSPQGSLPYALLLFLQIPHPDLFLFNLMIRAFSYTKSPQTGLTLFLDLLNNGCLPNHFTFPFLLKSCAAIPAIAEGKAIHGFAIKIGHANNAFVESNLIHMYCSFGLVEFAHQVFEKMFGRDVVSITSMLVGYAQSGRITDARNLFEKMPERDHVAWSAMVTGCIQGGYFAEGLEFFDTMRVLGILPNEGAVVSALTACSHLGAIEQGEQIHAYIEKTSMIFNEIVGTSLVDMYAKFGKIESGICIFDMLHEKSLISWTVMIKALAMNGLATKALDCLVEMRAMGIEPDGDVFVGVLSACAHAGMVEEGRECFYSIPAPRLDHFTCMVDLLGRAGHLDEAEEMIRRMPMQPDGAIWGALLNACKNHGNIQIGERAGLELMKLGTEDGGHFVLLSNMYASSKRWVDVVRVRQLMVEAGIERLPGFSSLEINGVTHEFVAGDKAHPQSEKIYSQLHEMIERLRLEGYRENTEEVLIDVDEDDKRKCLSQHSEKLAVAFGFINSGSHDPLYIIKNLRVCCDCHNFMKLVSRVFKRRIIMRDRNRFHHFSQGSCSCNNHW